MSLHESKMFSLKDELDEQARAARAELDAIEDAKKRAAKEVEPVVEPKKKEKKS